MSGRNSEAPIVVWLRNDLRLDDNPALASAAKTGRPVVPLVVLDEETEGLRMLGGAHRWWLHHSLSAFGKALAELGAPLVLRRGASVREVAAVMEAAGATSLFFNRRYGRAARACDDAVAVALGDAVDVRSFHANVLFEPDALKTKSGGVYKVFAPYLRAAKAAAEPRAPIAAPGRLRAARNAIRSDAVADWDLLPKTTPDWSENFDAMWTPGETSARAQLADFCAKRLADYPAERDNLGANGTSRLSPHLRWGELSPFRVRAAVLEAAKHREAIAEGDVDRFLFELSWRDYNRSHLFHFPDLPTANFNATFDRLEWRHAPAELAAWQRGRTGYPVVDAAMRQLWRTGWMHNRARLVVGSFLTRDLLIDWREGEAWFWDTLVDGDLANNTAQWQWIAGTGADPQPFFRIFNPVAQSRKFDPDGAYIRAYVPELAKLPDDALHAPWEADARVLAKAGVRLGETYPRPIIDHKTGRERALAAYRTMRAN